MALVPVRGMGITTGRQTGDGRYVVPGAVGWSDLPLPIAVLDRGDQHLDVLMSAPTVGNIRTMIPVGDGIAYSGVIDDSIPEGAEMIRRMRAGSAPGGNRYFVSADPDNWAVQLVDTSGAEAVPLLASSGVNPAGRLFDWDAPRRALLNAAMIARRELPTTKVYVDSQVTGMQTTYASGGNFTITQPGSVMTAAAGDGDPLAAGGTVLMEDAADSLVARFTRLRLRGLTAVSVPAFADCYIELDETPAVMTTADAMAYAATLIQPDEEALASFTAEAAVEQLLVYLEANPELEAADAWMALAELAADLEPESELVQRAETALGLHEPALEPVAAAAAPAPVRVGVSLATPPAAWFPTNPDLPFATPLTITDEGRVFGHIAAWGTCHTGYQDRCVTPPRGSYDRYLVGETELSDGRKIGTGVFAWGIPHADLRQSMIAAFDHYSNSRHSWARVVVGEDRHGIWFSGALNPGLLPDDIAVLRSLSMSGDWRRDPASRRLALVAALAVNFPGFPIARADSSSLVAASGELVAEIEAWLETPEATMELDGDEIVSLVACGRLAPRALTAGCGCEDGSALGAQLALVEQRLERAERLLAAASPLIAEQLDLRLR